MKRLLPLAILTLSTALAPAAEPAKPWAFSPQCLHPFWLSTTMEGESVLFTKDAADAPPAAPLLLEPTRILSVCSSSGEVTFTEGRDYVWNPAAKRIVLPRFPDSVQDAAGPPPTGEVAALTR